MIRKGDILDVKINDVKFPNIGVVALEDDKNIRIKGALLGEEVKIKISKKRKNHYEGKVVEILKESELETKQACKHFGVCGGCSYQTLSYEDELKYKKMQIENLFKINELDVGDLEIIPSPVIKGYRNKMEFTFGDEYKDGPLALGMHRKRSFYEIESVTDCNICDEDFTTILDGSLKYFSDLDKTFYHKKLHKGLLRNVVIRKSLTKEEIIVNLVTTSQEEINKEDFINMILSLKLKAKVVGILHTINDGVADTVKADSIDILYGRSYLVEEICGLKFKISPFSFFQTNTFGAEVLYNTAKEFIGDIKDKTVFDLYSGTGTIAQIMAELAEKVVAVEIVDEAVDKAIENAKINDLNNIIFHKGDVFKVVDELDIKPDLIVLDPPRPGLGKAVEKIIDFDPEIFVYISCNPVTYVEDIKTFINRGYKIEKIKIVDQFPRTPHAEIVSKLVKE